LRRHRREAWARAAMAATGAFSIVTFALGALFYDWQSWSWERSRGVSESAFQWSLDPPQIWYTAAHAFGRIEPVTVASLVVVAACGLLLTSLAARGWSRSAPQMKPQVQRRPDDAPPVADFSDL
jgi:hypothetical protein